MRKEIILLGSLHIALSILYIVVSASALAVLFSKGFFTDGIAARTSEHVITVVLSVFLLLVSVCGIIAGAASMHDKNWAHMVVLILGCLDLICIPVGTMLGIYTIYIFMHDREQLPLNAEPLAEGGELHQDASISNFTVVDRTLSAPAL